MAESGFSLGKVLGWLKNFLKNMTSPLNGFEIDDAKMNVKDGEYAILYQFGSDQKEKLKDENGGDLTTIRGDKIELNMLVSTVNVKQVFEPILTGLNSISKENVNSPDVKALMYLLLGDDKYRVDEPEAKKESESMAVFDPDGNFVEHIDVATEEGAAKATQYKSKGYTVGASKQVSKTPVMAADYSHDYNVAKANGRGLLGVDLEKSDGLPYHDVKYKGQSWSWNTIAGDFLKYALECTMPDKDYGAIENVTASECAKLVPEYLMKMNVIANADEVHLDVVSMVKPIMIRLQADLSKYYTDAVNKYMEGYSTKEKEQMDETSSEIEDELFNEGENGGEAENNGQQDNEFDAEDYAQHLVDTLNSRQISVTLKKITASNELQLLGLQSNYSPSETLDDLEDAIYQDEFMDVLTEEPQSFTINVDDDGYDIDTCEACDTDPCASLCEVFKAGVRAYRNLYIIHWMSKGNDMMKLHTMAEEMYGELIQEIDTIGELLVEKQGTVPQLDFPCDYVPVQDYDFQTGLDYIQSLIQMYIDCIDYAYCNQDSDVQSTLDEWLRYWKKQLNYFVERQS